ncbi:MAG: hypothetical protein HYR85_07870 [Planctomycetes bacterium]|nr:hypothetical protein [Planctomycetota bacterium]MBI3848156.1 hypothetical protein [Planctomycetota bacterium]
MEFPHLAELSRDLASQDFVVFSVNPGLDAAPAILDHWKAGKYSWDTIAVPRDDANVLKLGISTFPTNYLIGKDGSVLWRGVGFDEKALRKALRAAGLEPK